MGRGIEDLLEETDESLESFLSTVNRRTNIFRGYARDEVDENTYNEEVERTDEVEKELEEVERNFEYLSNILYERPGMEFEPDEDDRKEELRGDFMQMKGMYDGLVSRLKEADQTARLEREDRKELEPSYLDLRGSVDS